MANRQLMRLVMLRLRSTYKGGMEYLYLCLTLNVGAWCLSMLFVSKGMSEQQRNQGAGKTGCNIWSSWPPNVIKILQKKTFKIFKGSLSCHPCFANIK